MYTTFTMIMTDFGKKNANTRFVTCSYLWEVVIRSSWFRLFVRYSWLHDKDVQSSVTVWHEVSQVPVGAAQWFIDTCTTLMPGDAYIQIYRNEPDHHCFRYWLVACSVSSHYLSQCWLLANWTLRHKLENFKKIYLLFPTLVESHFEHDFVWLEQTASKILNNMFDIPLIGRILCCHAHNHVTCWDRRSVINHPQRGDPAIFRGHVHRLTHNSILWDKVQHMSHFRCRTRCGIFFISKSIMSIHCYVVGCACSSFLPCDTWCLKRISSLL